MKMMKKVLVTGANGQLGRCIEAEIKKVDLPLEFDFMSSSLLDITNEHSVLEHFKNQHYDYCINCAAYTQVDSAEIDQEKAFLINENGPRNLARACKQSNTILLHISTDFVFDGKTGTPYSEKTHPNPIGIYGLSKFRGEQEIVRNLDTYFIIRTSWLYSVFGNNFMKSMIKHGTTKNTLSVVYDQVGTPTFANDLVKVLLHIILNEIKAFGIYNYSNEGVASWFDFAKAIFEINDIDVDLRPIRTKEYPLPAARPAFSVLDKEKIKKTLQIVIPHWRDSLLLGSNELENVEAEIIKKQVI